ncbi:uncharacterized protein BDW70DRAFT_156908 [Aspergillus foveolatus]|uniref:uncharacterized protein n=1 Tax=Aspergillus foveolatus TaxID=210207 RepID=UPI003CCCD383
MAPSLVTIDSSQPLEEIYKPIERDGGVIVSNSLSSELLKKCMEAIEPFFKGRKIYGSNATHEELGPNFFPEGSQRVYDQIAYQVRPDPNNPFFTPMVGCRIAGSKTAYKNGATAVIPGSHLWGPDRMPKLEECTYAEMDPGSALFTLGCNALMIDLRFCAYVATYHGAGENKCKVTDPLALRTLFDVFGQRDYFRQDQEEVLSTPIETVRQLPEDILKLAGYYKAVGGVGYLEDHQSPHEFLHSDDFGAGKFGAANLVVLSSV